MDAAILVGNRFAHGYGRTYTWVNSQDLPAPLIIDDLCTCLAGYPTVLIMKGSRVEAIEGIIFPDDGHWREGWCVAWGWYDGGR
jgi:hypothetical protein